MNKMEKYRIEFIKPIGTYPKGSDFVLGEYKVTFEKEIVRLHLKINEGHPEYEKMGKPSREEMKPPYDFIRSKEGQEKFFRGKGLNIVTETLNRLGGIEEIRKLRCGQIFSHSENIKIMIKSIKGRN